MAYNELCERIDASIWILCFIIWIREEVNCEGACFALHFLTLAHVCFICILDMSSPLLSSAEHCMGNPYSRQVGCICGERKITSKRGC